MVNHNILVLPDPQGTFCATGNNLQFLTGETRNLLLAYYRKPVEGEPAKNLTVSQIMLRFGAALRLNKSQLSAALKELGFTLVRTGNGRFWQLVERTGQEVEQLLPEPVEEIIPGSDEPAPTLKPDRTDEALTGTEAKPKATDQDEDKAQ